MKILLELLFSFARIGLFTFGGGYAMIALIEDLCVARKRWITHDEMLDITVIAESTPGPIAINCATYVGYKCRGLAGAGAATLGMVLPSFCIIFIISMYLDRFLEIRYVACAFSGIELAVGILIVDAAAKMIAKMRKTLFSCIIMGSAFFAMLLIDLLALRISSVSLMLVAAAFSLAVFAAKRHARTEGKEK